MILPIVLDTCSLLNLLRIDEEDEFLFKKLTSLNINICECVYKEAFNNIDKDGFNNQQRDYISKQIPKFSKFKRSIDEDFQNQYTDEIKKFCNYKKDNGEFCSTLLSLYMCREDQCRLYFYTDDYPAKKTFANFFIYQQIGTIGDTVDLLLFMYWIDKDFKWEKLIKYLKDLYSEYATPIKLLLNKICENKERWLINKPRDKKLYDNLCKLEVGLRDIDFDKINSGIKYFNENRTNYKEIYGLIETYPKLQSDAGVANKLHDIIIYTRSNIIYKK